MGISGFAFKEDSVCFVNDFSNKKNAETNQVVAEIASRGANIISPS